MILIDRTFETVSEESAEYGETEDAGFSALGEKYTFRELVQVLKQVYIHPSQSPANRSTRVWFTSEAEQDYATGDYRSESIHFSADNPKRKAKHWVRAMQCAGVRLSADHNIISNPFHPYAAKGARHEQD